METFEYCEYCGDKFFKEDLKETPNGRRICSVCAEKMGFI